MKKKNSPANDQNQNNSENTFENAFETIGLGVGAPSPAGTITPSVFVPVVSMMQNNLSSLNTLAETAATVAGIAEIPGPVKAVAKMSAKSAAAGAIVDAALAGLNTLQPLSKGDINLKQAGIHVASEGLCGFLTAGAGTAGSISAYMLTGSLGPVVIASGMASSMAVRWGYRQVVGETLPQEDEKQKPKKDDADTFEDIGKGH